MGDQGRKPQPGVARMSNEQTTRRAETITQRIDTPFGAMYLHVEVDSSGRMVGGGLSNPNKEPDSHVQQLVYAISDGLRDLGETIERKLQ